MIPEPFNAVNDRTYPAAMQERRKRNLALRRAGQGYIPPRRSLGGQHMTTGERQAAHPYAGYSPQTAGQFGGRPVGGGQAPMVQPQALTRNTMPARSYIRRPFGGRSAVVRQPIDRTALRGW